MSTVHQILSEAPAAPLELQVLEQLGPSVRARSAGEDILESPGEDVLDQDLGGFVLRDQSGRAYNADAFHYFLEIERRRAGVSNRPFLLMLIDFPQRRGTTGHIDVVTAGKLFPILWRCFRETDFVGWYRDERVIGAVLPQYVQPNGYDLPKVLRERVARALEEALPLAAARRLQVRFYQVSGAQAE